MEGKGIVAGGVACLAVAIRLITHNPDDIVRASRGAIHAVGESSAHMGSIVDDVAEQTVRSSDDFSPSSLPGSTVEETVEEGGESTALGTTISDNASNTTMPATPATQEAGLNMDLLLEGKVANTNQLPARYKAIDESPAVSKYKQEIATTRTEMREAIERSKSIVDDMQGKLQEEPQISKMTPEPQGPPPKKEFDLVTRQDDGDLSPARKVTKDELDEFIKKRQAEGCAVDGICVQPSEGTAEITLKCGNSKMMLSTSGGYEFSYKGPNGQSAKLSGEGLESANITTSNGVRSTTVPVKVASGED